MPNLTDAPSLTALRGELESIDAETFEIVDHVDIDAELPALVPPCGCACVTGCNSCNSCSCNSCF